MTMRVRAFLMLVAGLAVMGLASCGHYTCGAGFGSSTCTASGPPSLGGGGGNGASGTVYAYLLFEVGSSDGMAADTLSLSANTWLEASGFVAPPLPSLTYLDGGTAVVNLPNQKYLYIPFHNGTVYGYAIDGTTGALTSVPNSPYTVAGGTSIAVNPAGTFLFVSDSVTGGISVFSISATDGSLTAVGSPFASGIAAAQLATDGSGNYLYATAGTGGAQVAAMSIGPTGTLTLVSGSPFNFPMAVVLGENSGKYLLGISGFDSHIHVFDINSGVITEGTGSPFATASIPENMVLSPNGNFVYAFDGEETPMEGYSLENLSTGALTAVSGSPFTGINLQVGRFDQSGDYLFGISEGSLSAEFLPYSADPSTGIISTTTYAPLGIPEGSFAISDLNDAP